MIDYQAANRRFRFQKAALTRAVNSKDRNKVIETCRKTVKEWSEAPFGGAWPDDWAYWQRALDDVFPVFQAPDLRDL
jgi:hypothetical protein